MAVDTNVDTDVSELPALDALGYYDTEYDDPYWQAKAHVEIEEEMYRMANDSTLAKRDYLGEKGLHPYKVTFKQGSILATEYARVKAGVPMKRLDDSRYAVAPPVADSQGDQEAWRKAIANAKSRLQHQISRQLNLVLLGIHGGNAWLHYNKVLAALEESATVTGKRLKDETDSINHQRQTSTEVTGRQLYNMDAKRIELADKNMQIALANQSLEQELKRYKTST